MTEAGARGRRMGTRLRSARQRARRSARRLITKYRSARPASSLHRATEYEAWCTSSGTEPGSRTPAAHSQGAGPLITLLMAVHNPPIQFLEEALDSILDQTSPDWELVLSDDGTTDRRAHDLLDRLVAQDDRVRLLRSPEPRGIVAALSAALVQARGSYVGVLDHDDRLHPRAVELMGQFLARHPESDLVYSDEDKIDESGRHYDPFFKPSYSPEMLLGSMYLNHFTVMRRSLVDDVGGFRAGTDGAQDHDLALRMVRAGANIAHQPGVLYHWRAWSGSTASGIQAKPWAQEAAAEVQRAHIQALGFSPEVAAGAIPGLNDVRLGISGNPLVSVIIPTASKRTGSTGQAATYVEQCLRSLRALSGLDRLEVVVVHTGPVPERQARLFRDFGAVVVAYPDEPFNFSSAINTGVRASRGEYVLLLNDDTEIIRTGSVRAMLEMAQLPDVGAVGARLSYPDGRNQHSGILMVAGMPTHPHHGASPSSTGYFGSVVTLRNYLAVTGAALMTGRALFDDLHGLDERWPNDYQDVDFCLRLHERGLRCVYTPYAHFIHHENVSLGRRAPDPAASAQFRLRWSGESPLDPYYSPALNSALDSLYTPL